MPSAAKYLPRITSLSVSGMVMRSSRVPERFSSAMARMVTSGMTSTESASGRHTSPSNMRAIEARFTCQKPP